MAFEAVGGRIRSLNQVKSKLPLIGEIWISDFYYLWLCRVVNFSLIGKILFSFDCIVSGNSLEPKNVFLRQKTSKLIMFYGKKNVLKNAQKSQFLRLGFFFIFWTWRPQFWSDFIKVGLILSLRELWGPLQKSSCPFLKILCSKNLRVGSYKFIC